MPKSWLATKLVEVLLVNGLAKHWLEKCTQVGTGALVCQKVGHTPNRSQCFGHDQKISRAHFGHDPNVPLETEAKSLRKFTIEHFRF